MKTQVQYTLDAVTPNYSFSQITIKSQTSSHFQKRILIPQFPFQQIVSFIQMTFLT